MPARAPRDTTVVVLGCGINGAALARELLLSGVRVVVVEAADIACGATAWSTRLVHGGLRYLEYGELGLVRESLHERDRLVRLAPHLVWPLEFFLPVRTRWGRRGSVAVGIGLTVYDALAVGSCWPRHRAVRTGAPGLPAIDAREFPRGVIYADAQMLFPERFTVELCVDARRVAAEQGTEFHLLTHATVERRADGGLRLRGRDGTHDVEPAAIVNATGAWADFTRAEILPGAVPRLIGGTKGSHLVLDAAPLRAALGERGVYAEADDGRPVFVLPFGPRLVLVGTTDIPYAGDPAAAKAEEREIAYLLAAVARLFPAVAPGRDAVQQHYCGVRPLPAAEGAVPAAVTRRHMLVRHPHAPQPTWSIVGGKLTTCRSLAEQAAREILAAVGLPVLATSRERPLPGALAATDPAVCVSDFAATLRAAGADGARAEAAATAAVSLFGTRARDVCRAAAEMPRGVPAILAGADLPTAAVGFCVREEWAGSLADLIERRLMLSFAPGLAVDTLAAMAAELVRLGMLPADRAAAEVDHCVRMMHERYGKSVE